MFFKYNWPGITWILVILVLTGLPGNYFPQVRTFWEWLGPDKIIHIGIFGILTCLLLRGFQKQYQFQRLRSNYIIFAIGIGIVFGALTEVGQRYVFIGRSANIYDFLANTVGCLLGLVVYYILSRKLNKILES